MYYLLFLIHALILGNIQVCSVQVFASDINILALLLINRERIKCSRIFIETDVETLVKIDARYKILRSKVPKAKLSLHSLMDCDTFDHFNGISKNDLD